MAKKRKHHKSKSKKRSLAAKKAARTRAHKKAVRRRAALKAVKARKRKHVGKKAYHRRRRHHRARRGSTVIVRRVKPHKWRVIRRPRKGKKGRLAAAYIRRHRLRVKNPRSVGGVMYAIKAAIPIGVGFVGSKMIANAVKKLPVVGGVFGMLGGFGDLAASVAAVVAVSYAPKVPVIGKYAAKYEPGLMIGAGLAALVEGLKAVGLGGPLGLGEYVTSDSLGAYEEAAEYVSTDEYEEMAAYEEAAEYVDTSGIMQGLPKGGLTGLHSRTLGRLLPAPMAQTAPITGNLPEPEEAYYSGVFAGGFGY